jgi:choline monooxygenase
VFDPSTSRDYFLKRTGRLLRQLSGEFHLPYVHGASLAGLDYGEYRTGFIRLARSTLGVKQIEEDSFTLPEDHPDRAYIAAFFLALPNLMMNFYPWGVSVNVVYPLGRARAISFSQLRLGQRSAIKRRRRRSSSRGNGDEEVVESVQRGVQSSLQPQALLARRSIRTHHLPASRPFLNE